MAIFRFLKMAATIVLDFQNAGILSSEGSRGSKCIIVPNFTGLVKPLLRYGNLSIFQNGGHCQLGFLKGRSFKG